MSSSRKAPRVRALLCLLLLAGTLPTIGCAGTSHTVTGKVTLDRAPVSGGTVYFTRYDTATTYKPDGSVANTFVTPIVTSATIGSDGTFSVSLGESYTYTITLTNPQAPLPGPIPDRYATDTGLRYLAYADPISGDYVCNINLTR